MFLMNSLNLSRIKKIGIQIPGDQPHLFEKNLRKVLIEKNVQISHSEFLKTKKTDTSISRNGFPMISRNALPWLLYYFLTRMTGVMMIQENNVGKIMVVCFKI